MSNDPQREQTTSVADTAILELQPVSVTPASGPGIDSLSDIWHAVREHLRGQLSSDVFTTWIVPATLLDLTHDRAVIGVPNVFARDALVAEHLPTLEQALDAILGASVSVDVAIDTLRSMDTAKHKNTGATMYREPARSNRLVLKQT